VKHLTYRLQILNNLVEAYLFDSSGNRLDLVSPVNSIADTAWHHIAMTQDATSIRLYIDGVSKAVLLPGSIPAVASNPNREVIIGKDPWGNSFLGDIDEVRLYRRTLAASEITALAALTGPTPTPTSTLTPTITRTPTRTLTSTPEPVRVADLDLFLPFEGNLLDLSGDLNSGYWLGSPSYSPGWKGNGIRLNGSTTGGCVVVPHANTLDGMDEMTLSVWARKATVSAGGFLIQKHLSYKLEILNNQLEAYLFDSSGTRFNLSTPANSVADTSWHHFAMTQDAASIRLYIDGTQGAVLYPGSFPGIAAHPDRDVVIGKNPWGNSFLGDIDEVCLYGSALTSSEINSLAKEATKSQPGSAENATPTATRTPTPQPTPLEGEVSSSVEAWMTSE
jgi:hypothetical protein